MTPKEGSLATDHTWSRQPNLRHTLHIGIPDMVQVGQKHSARLGHVREARGCKWRLVVVGIIPLVAGPNHATSSSPDTTLIPGWKLTTGPLGHHRASRAFDRRMDKGQAPFIPTTTNQHLQPLATISMEDPPVALLLDYHPALASL